MPRTFVHLHAWRLRGLIRATAWAAVCMLSAGAPASRAELGTQTARPQVLVLMSYHPGHSWEDRILAGLNEWGGKGVAKGWQSRSSIPNGWTPNATQAWSSASTWPAT